MFASSRLAPHLRPMVGQSSVLGAAYGSSFMIVGSILAIAFYEISRRLAAGEPISFTGAFAPFRRNPRQIAVMSFVLLLILLTWLRIAAMIFMLYWGLEPPSSEELVVNTFLRPASLPFLIIGTAIGGLFALFPLPLAPSRSRCWRTGAGRTRSRPW